MRIAILLDLDNIRPKLPHIEEICKSFSNGEVVYRHAFSNTPSVLTAYGGAFRELGYRFELTPGLDPQPQEVDALITRTARELCRNSELRVETIAIVSNDNGYASLFDELKGKRIKTLAIGTGQIGQLIREHADEIVLLEEVLRPLYVGVDLGTTNTVMALASVGLGTGQWTANEISVQVTNEQASLMTSAMVPSSVRFTGQQAEVGGHVRAQAYAFRNNTILAWKHDMGRAEKGRPCGYNLSVGRIMPEQAAGEVLRFCRQQLVRKFPTVQGAVITHPASYEADAVEATLKAAVLAGWREEEVVLLPEPHAALYDFLHRLERGEIVLPFEVEQPTVFMVYDLGGGTLDVSLHRVQWDANVRRFIIRDISVGSRTRVGGDNVDQLITDYVLHQCGGWSLVHDDQIRLGYELLIYAEKFKRLWGSQYANAPDPQAFFLTFQGNFLDERMPIRTRINASLMRQILEPLLCPDLDLSGLAAMDPAVAFDHPPFTDRFHSFVVPVLEILLKARQSLGQMPKVDAVLLNGGMTYFPLVRDRLQELFRGVPLLDQGNPDLAVARGAALYAAGAQGRAAQRVNPTNLYLEVQETNQRKLRLLMAQGQTYPYKTRQSGFRLPAAREGSLISTYGLAWAAGLNTIRLYSECVMFLFRKYIWPIWSRVHRLI